MIERKRAGVDVRVIVDDFYTFSISSFAIGILETGRDSGGTGG